MSLAHLDLPTLSRRRAERHDAAVREYAWLMDSMKEKDKSDGTQSDIQRSSETVKGES